MLINIIEHQSRDLHDSSKYKYLKDKHTEIHTITTIWLLFIPIWRYKKLKATNIN